MTTMTSNLTTMTGTCRECGMRVAGTTVPGTFGYVLAVIPRDSGSTAPGRMCGHDMPGASPVPVRLDRVAVASAF